MSTVTFFDDDDYDDYDDGDEDSHNLQLIDTPIVDTDAESKDDTKGKDKDKDKSKDDAKDKGNGGTKGTSAAPSTTSSTAQTTPKTDDSLDCFPGLFALTAASAAMVAYSKRRVENERERAGEESE